MIGRNEWDTCRGFVVPRSTMSGWENSFRSKLVGRFDLETNTTSVTLVGSMTR